MRVHGPDAVEAVPIYRLHSLHHVTTYSQSDVRVCGPGRFPDHLVNGVEAKTGANDVVCDLLACGKTTERLRVGLFEIRVV